MSISRRHLLGAGAAAASASLLNAAQARAQSTRPADDIRCGIIGVGGRGTGLLHAIHKSPGVRVTAICDINSRHVERAVKHVKDDQPKTFTDYRALVDYPELDAIFVATPCYLHKEQAVAVLESNRSCYCEKPMALSVADCNAVLAASKRSKGIFQIGTQLRYTSPFYPAITAIRAGEFGKPLMIRAHRHNIGDYPRGSDWFFKREQSGDTILEQAVHEFDLFNWILDGIPVRASGFGALSLHKEPEWRTTIDNYVMAFDYGDKGRISYNHSWISVPKTYCDGRQEVVYCEKAAIDIENGMIFPREGEPRKVSDEPKGDSTQVAADHFFGCLRERKTPLTNAEAGRNSALVGLIGQRAMDAGRVVTMDELLAQG